jgi:multidrug transporter EmrE-like cation transporter
VKLSNGSSNLGFLSPYLRFPGIAFTAFIFVLKTFVLSLAYALWVGSGIVIAGVVGVLYFKTRKPASGNALQPQSLLSDRPMAESCMLSG